MTPKPVSVNILGRFCLRPFKFSTLVNEMGLFCLPSYPQTADLPGSGASLWMVTFQTRGPSTLEGVFPDGHLSNPGTVHVRGRFSGWSPFKPEDRPRQRPFFRMVAFQTRGPSTSEAVFPDGQLSNPGTIHARGYFPGQSACGAGRDGARRPWGVVENIDYYHFFVIFVEV